MKLEKWALIAEILSAIAVVVSLVFVGLQIRQGAEETALNTRAIETSAFQDLTTQINAITMEIAGNSQLAELGARIRQGGRPETPQEQLQMVVLIFSVYRHGELAFRQYENELIDEEALVGMLAPVRFWLEPEMVQEVWRLQKHALNADYVAYVEAWVEGAGLNVR
jgi:hypothetical protein